MKKKGMATMEVCVLTALVSIALLAMQGYFRGALQGYWRGNVDTFSDEQYNPPDDEELDPGASSESGRKITQGKQVIEIPPENITIINPLLSVSLGADGKREQAFNLASGEVPSDKPIQIQGWGTYFDPAKHEDN